MIFRQGDIVKFNFDPTLGHEQAGYRPALVVSQDLFNANTKQIVVCPITNKTKLLPMRIALDGRTSTTGYIICDQIRTIDIIARKPSFVEKMPKDLLELALETIMAVFQMPKSSETEEDDDTETSLGDSFTADEVEEIRKAVNADESEYVDFEL